MPAENGRPRTTVEELARRLRPEFASIDHQFSFYLAHPIAEEDLRQYLQDPIGALPAAVRALLPSIGLVLAPYLERSAGRSGAAVTNEKPTESRLMLSARVITEARSGDNVFASLFFTVRDEQVSDYHYYFFEEIATLLADRITPAMNSDYHRLLREELSAQVHGETDQRSWHLKQSLMRRPMTARKDSKTFRDYAKQSFIDTATLFLHGLCCDIDVETGPRQLPSRYVRKRLETLKALFPPPEGHAIFPEDMKRR